LAQAEAITAFSDLIEEVERPPTLPFEPWRPHEQDVPGRRRNFDCTATRAVGADAEPAITAQHHNGDERRVFNVIPVRGDAKAPRLVTL
jgi:hypothetical protein